MGYRIRECREELKMTQVELSKRANVSRTIISGLESGAIAVTTTETLLKIAQALGKTVSEMKLRPWNSLASVGGREQTKRLRGAGKNSNCYS